MIDLEAWIARLKDECTELCGYVYDAAEAWRTAEAPPASPTVYVGPHTDQALKPDYLATAGTVQDIEAQVAVLIAAKEQRDLQFGESAIGNLRAVRRAIARVLLGWQPPDASTPVAFESGGMMQWVNGRYLWEDRYRCRFPLAGGLIETGPVLVHLTHVSPFETQDTILHEDGTITMEHTTP